MSGEAGDSPIADFYGLAAELLSFPGPGLAAALRGGEVRGAAEHILAHIRVELSVPLSVLGPIDIADKELESEFIRLFDVPDGPATPLYTGVYAQRRRDAMEELLRIYRHFGLTIGNASQDLPDFVPTILEFMQFLAAGAAQAEDAGREPFLAATADIIERHLGPWVAETSTRLEKRNAHPFYRGLIAMVGEVAAAEAAGIRGED